jgi:ribonuclease E
LRLRDLAGLIVIDFIDMDEKRNNRAVERRLKECLRHDRARIQVGHISHFGLLEMSRQRIRSSVLESSTEKCSHCGGTGHVRSVSSVALQLLRALEEMLLKGATHNLAVRTRSDIALYLLNQKRAHLRALEERFRIAIMVNADATIGGQLSFVIEKGEQVHSLEQAKALALQPAAAVPIEEVEEEEYEDEEESESEDVAASASEEEAHAAGEPGTGRKRRRRRRGRRGGEGRDPFQPEREALAQEEDFAPVAGEHEAARSDQALHADGAELERPSEPHGESERRRRRRGRRGGRRNRRGREGEGLSPETAVEPAPAHADAAADSADEVTFAAAEESEPELAPAGKSEPEALAAPIGETHSDALPTHEAEPAHEAEPQEARSAQIAAPAPPETSEPPRRRSTVREPAPQTWRDDATPPPPAFTTPVPPIEPVVTSSAASEGSDRPRRSGWWSRRVLGKS